MTIKRLLTLILSFLVLAPVISAMSVSQQVNADINSSEQAQLGLGQDNTRFTIKDFDANSFVVCQRQVQLACGNAASYQDAQACLRAMKPISYCKDFYQFMQKVAFSPRDMFDQYKYYNGAKVYVFRLKRWGANYPGDYYLIDSQNTVIDVNQLAVNLNIKSASNYSQIAYNYPNVELFALTNEMPRLMTTSVGGYHLIFRFLLLNGCHACARVGFANVGFKFTKDGKFQGVELLSLEAAPLS